MFARIPLLRQIWCYLSKSNEYNFHELIALLRIHRS